MEYDKDILQVLAEAGQSGLTVKKITHHVFNACNGLFCTVCYDDVYQYVRQYLARNSKSSNSVIEKTGEWGTYRINLNSGESEQLMLKFTDVAVDENETSQLEEDQSLNLF